MKNYFLFVTANSNERDAFEHVFKSDKKECIKGKIYKIGKFGLYDAAYIHIDEQGIADPASVPIVGELIRIIEPVGIVMVGIAFGVDERNQKIGDVLVSKKILFYDSEKIKEDINEYKEDVKEVGFQLFNAFCDDEDWIYYIDKDNISKVHKGAMLTGSKLINGYSFTDPDIDFLLQEIMADYNGKARKHYALLPDMKNIQKEYLQNEYNIRVISYETINNSHIVANEFLKKIIESI